MILRISEQQIEKQQKQIANIFWSKLKINCRQTWEYFRCCVNPVEKKNTSYCQNVNQTNHKT